jgi:hypothetical protein
MIISEVKIEPFEDSWRDWFIIDEPQERMNLSIFLDGTRHFYIDPRFQSYKMTALIDYASLNVYKFYYMFKTDHSRIQSMHAYVKHFDNNYVSKKYLECILTRGEKYV